MEQLLSTKLYIPPTRPQFVPRPRLIEQLNEGLHRKLTFISAPAGFGKTTLMSEWVDNLGLHIRKSSQVEYKVAWLSLDESDNDLARFLNYLIAALNRAAGSDSDLGEKARTMLNASQSPPPTEAILISLINEVAALSNGIVLVFDDYHMIESPSVDDAITFLLEHLPPGLHVVLATRVDPQLPLSRLRARDQVTELRARDLRFTASEVAEFLNRVMGLGLSGEDIAALERRTEGWAAGLQLAAISLQGQTDTSRLIRSFTGSHRLVLDYLIEEVLERQSETIQKFLLRTAILDRLTGSLCDAVTDQENGQTTLEMLEHANMFIVPLDNERGWYRYHQLFADLLRQRLHQNDLENIPELNLRASWWYEEKGLWSDAIRHAFAAEDFERAADLVELAWRPMNTSYRSVTWLGWAKALPDELVRSRPVLSTACGWASLDTGDLEAAELRFRDAEGWLDNIEAVNEQPKASPDKTVIPDEEGVRSLSISIANGRAYLAQALGDVTGTIKYAQRATELLRENEYFDRGLSDILAGFAYWADGNLEAAHQAVADAISKMQTIGKIPFVISFTSYLADIMTAQGRLHETERTYLQLLETVTAQGKPEVRETAVLHLGLSELYLERGEIEVAKQHLQKAKELGEQPAFPPWYRHWICTHARMLRTDGDLDGVIRMLNGAERLYYRHPIPDVRPLAALTARTWLAMGKLTEVQRWVGDQGLSVDDDLSYLREFEHISLARVLITRYRSSLGNDDIHDAMQLLERLFEAAENGGRTGSVIEILVLRALACEAQGDIPYALTALERALTLAEPEGYFQIFIDEGPPMARLLYEALSQEISADYVRRLLANSPTTELGQPDMSQAHSSEFDMIEPLSERELEILQLIAEGLTNQEIGSQLYLSLNTVKAHTRSIYGKLGVNSRTQATARARTLGILSAS